MRVVQYSKSFRKDYKRLMKSGRYDIEKLDKILSMLIDGIILPAKYRDHPLQGIWNNCRDCHIEGDWILIYEINNLPSGE